MFHKILLSGFRGVALTNCFSSIFHFGQIGPVVLEKQIFINSVNVRLLCHHNLPLGKERDKHWEHRCLGVIPIDMYSHIHIKRYHTYSYNKTQAHVTGASPCAPIPTFTTVF